MALIDDARLHQVVFDALKAALGANCLDRSEPQPTGVSVWYRLDAVDLADRDRVGGHTQSDNTSHHADVIVTVKYFLSDGASKANIYARAVARRAVVAALAGQTLEHTASSLRVQFDRYDTVDDGAGEGQELFEGGAVRFMGLAHRATGATVFDPT